MNSLKPAALVHFYDTRSRAIACGVGSFDHRSTKHPRQVTCHSCVELIGERPSLAAVAAGEPAAGIGP
jgi:hypothetical protein